MNNLKLTREDALKLFGELNGYLNETATTENPRAFETKVEAIVTKTKSEKWAWAIVRHCAECFKPVGIINICSELGYNPGVDGHLYDDQIEATKALNLLIKEVEKDGEEEFLKYFKNQEKVKIMKVTFSE